MSEHQSVARPYAQAVFEIAREDGNFQAWSDILAFFAALMAHADMRELVRNPRVERAQVVQLVEGICGDRLFPRAKSFLRLVIDNRRELSLQKIASQFEAMRAEAEGKIDAELITARPVTEPQRLQIAQSLSQRLGREVSLQITEDPGLIGGAVLRAGDMVVDASVKGRLATLAAHLVH